MLRPVLPAVVALILLTGCKTPTTASRQPPVPHYVYDTPSDQQLSQRAAELQKHGYTPDAALKKARVEAAGQTWHSGTTAAESWADQKARQARSDANEKMEKDLAKLDLP
jgi:hypothetical protein